MEQQVLIELGQEQGLELVLGLGLVQGPELIQLKINNSNNSHVLMLLDVLINSFIYYK
jgi:hypothetical protein